jgi:hypothetical protein
MSRDDITSTTLLGYIGIYETFYVVSSSYDDQSYTRRKALNFPSYNYMDQPITT